MMNYVIEFFGTTLCLLFMLKSYATLKAINWVFQHGPNHKINITTSSNPTEDAFYRSFERENADFFPFGVKEWRLRRWLTQHKSERPLSVWLIEFARRNLFSFNRMAFLAALFQIGGTSYLGIESDFNCPILPIQLRTLIAVLAFLSMFQCILILLENIVGHWLLGDYPKYFHMLTIDSGHEGKQLLNRSKVLGGSLLCGIAVGASAVFSMTVLFLAFVPIDGEPLTQSKHPSLVNLAVQSLYFTTTTLTTTGYGDMHASNAIGMVVSMMLQLFAMLILSFIVSQFLSFSKSDVKSETGANL